MNTSTLLSAADTPVVQHYGTVVIVGGGCYGSYYVRQMARARAAGAVTADRLLVVDRDPACAVALLNEPDVELRVAEWTPFFDDYLSTATGNSLDAIVPSPLMPHLMYQWLLSRAARRWPGRVVETRPLTTPTTVPWRQDAPDGSAYVSHATWMCPVNCIEPRLCPHTRDERTWSMPETARATVAASVLAAAGGPGVLQGPVIFHCTHRTYGVGMFDTRDVVAADQFVAAAGARGQADVLVGTVSHCHGALNVLHVGAERIPS